MKSTPKSVTSDEGEWYLEGYDTFAGEDYSIEGHYKTEQEALAAAARRREELERTQPSSSSGGQGFMGIQDRTFVCGPGKRYQY